MVNVGNKTSTVRIATAQCQVVFPLDVWKHWDGSELNGPKGPILQTALIAGIQGAKKTSELIPLCHPIPLNKIAISFESLPKAKTILIHATAETLGQTGVEMEALTGACIAALTIYDMCKGISHDIQIGPAILIQKSGGKRNFLRNLTSITK